MIQFGRDIQLGDTVFWEFSFHMTIFVRQEEQHKELGILVVGCHQLFRKDECHS